MSDKKDNNKYPHQVGCGYCHIEKECKKRVIELI